MAFQVLGLVPTMFLWRVLGALPMRMAPETCKLWQAARWFGQQDNAWFCTRRVDDLEFKMCILARA